MKRWALLTVLLYVVCLTVLTVPLFLSLPERNRSEQLLGFFFVWFVPILVLIQIVLLMVPVAVVQERPVKRRKIIVSAVIGAIPMGVMAACFFYSIVLMIWGEGFGNMGEYIGKYFLMPVIPVFWLVWGVVFYRSFSGEDPRSFTATLAGWLLRGSILELLVAIPSHIISRHRHECCAPTFTLFAIATGLSIALLSFGPAVFFLFAKRIKDKRGKQPPAPSNPRCV